MAVQPASPTRISSDGRKPSFSPPTLGSAPSGRVKPLVSAVPEKLRPFFSTQRMLPCAILPYPSAPSARKSPTVPPVMLTSWSYVMGTPDESVPAAG